MRPVLYIFLLAVCFYFGGCATPLPSLSGSGGDTFENDGSDFVELKNGTIINGNVGKDDLGKMMFARQAGSLEVNGQKVANSDIIAFQNNRKYYRKNEKGLFCVRIEKGNMNVYKRMEKGSDAGAGSTHAEFYLQKGASAALVFFKKKALMEMVADYQPASHWLEDGVFKKEKQNIYFNKAIQAYNKR